MEMLDTILITLLIILDGEGLQIIKMNMEVREKEQEHLEEEFII